MTASSQHSDPFVALLYLRKTDCDGCNGAADCIVSLVEQYEDALRQGLIIKERVNELEEQLETLRLALQAIADEGEYMHAGRWNREPALIASLALSEVSSPATELKS